MEKNIRFVRVDNFCVSWRKYYGVPTRVPDARIAFYRLDSVVFFDWTSREKTIIVRCSARDYAVFLFEFTRCPTLLLLLLRGFNTAKTYTLVTEIQKHVYCCWSERSLKKRVRPPPLFTRPGRRGIQLTWAGLNLTDNNGNISLSSNSSNGTILIRHTVMIIRAPAVFRVPFLYGQVVARPGNRRGNTGKTIHFNVGNIPISNPANVRERDSTHLLKPRRIAQNFVFNGLAEHSFLWYNCFLA